MAAYAATSAILASASCRVSATSMMPWSSLMAMNVPPKREGRSIKRIESVLIAKAIAREVELAMGASIWLALRGGIAALWRYVSSLEY